MRVAGRGDYGKRGQLSSSRTREWLNRSTASPSVFDRDISKESLLRISIEPSETNGLRVKTQVEKIITFPSEKVRGPVGHVAEDLMNTVDLGLLFHLDLLSPMNVSAR